MPGRFRTIAQLKGGPRTIGARCERFLAGRRGALLAWALVLPGIAAFVPAATAAVSAVAVVAGLASPVEIAHAGDGSGRLFVVEQGGRVRIVRGNSVAATPFLDIASRVTAGGERGLLGLAFHPQFRSNGRFFVNYTRAGDAATVIASYRVTPFASDTADPASEQVLLTIAQPFSNHNGGTIRFGPDGYLYIGMGDGGSGNDPGNRAQDVQSLLGKLLRIDVDGGVPYAIPPGNPFASGGGRPEIFALGLRNPWKFSFDRITGDLYVADVGQDAREEIDFVPQGEGRGANFGWRVMEGFRCTGLGGGPACNAPALTLPVFDYGRDQGCSVIGGYVHRGSGAATLAGRYVFADYCTGRISGLSRDASGAWRAEPVLQRGAGITSFGEDEAGALYFAAGAAIYRLADDSSPQVVTVVEYYNAGLDHYFLTGLPSEIDALDRGVLAGWARTGAGFGAYAHATTGINPVCRYYLPPGSGDSHFYSASPEECGLVAQRYPAFVLESAAAFALAPGPPDGICPIGLVPLYRLWNARRDTNHRYTTSASERDAMVARGYVAEGRGPDGVAMCAVP